MRFRLIEQDNPAAGACGYFSFINALIPYLQEEFNNPTQPQPLWDKLKISFDDNQQAIIQRAIERYCFSSPDERLLNELNVVFRQRLTDYRKEYTREIINSLATRKSGQEESESDYYEKLFNDRDYNNNTDLVRAISVFENCFQQEPIAIRGDYASDFSVSRVFCRRMMELASQVSKRDGYDLGIINSRGQSEAKDVERMKKRKLIVKMLPYIYAAMEPVIEQQNIAGAWATNDHLLTLAQYFEMEILLYSNGNDRRAGEPSDPKRVLRFNHLGNHWTTLFEAFPQLPAEQDVPESVAKLAILSNFASKLSVAEIKAVFIDYAGTGRSNRFFSGKWGRSQLTEAHNILAKCDEDTIGVDALLAHVITHTPDTCNRSGAFYNAVNYLCFREYGKSLVAHQAEAAADMGCRHN